MKDKEDIKNAKEIIKSELSIEVPRGLTLMPDENLLERHLNFYVSNKRLIKHQRTFMGFKTEDYHYRHIKGLQEKQEMPYLRDGLKIGIISLLLSTINGFFFIICVLSIVLAIRIKKTHLVVMHMDGRNISVPKIESDSGKKLAEILRTQLYNK